MSESLSSIPLVSTSMSVELSVSEPSAPPRFGLYSSDFLFNCGVGLLLASCGAASGLAEAGNGLAEDRTERSFGDDMLREVYGKELKSIEQGDG